MSAASNDPRISQLKAEAPPGGVYSEESLKIRANRITSNGFMGSQDVVVLTALDNMSFEAPGCLAAPSIHLIAKTAIGLGVTGQRNAPLPLRLYVPSQLSIMTKHLSVGDLKFLVEPKDGFVSCQKLTLVKTEEEEPPYFEIVKSWALNDNMEVEIQDGRI